MGLQHVADKDRAKQAREVAGGRSCMLSLIKFFVVLYVLASLFVMIVGILNPS
jgi:hypothetical protein